jgi:hypothetical protein
VRVADGYPGAGIALRNQASNNAGGHIARANKGKLVRIVYQRLFPSRKTRIGGRKINSEVYTRDAVSCDSVRLDSRTEYIGAYSNHRRTSCDGRFEILRHPHGKLVQVRMPGL